MQADRRAAQRAGLPVAARFSTSDYTKETQELMTNVFKPMRMLKTIKDGHWNHHLQANAMLKAGNIKLDTEDCNVA
ncbi:hypothetical protein [Cupriavidus necator]|uniref:hypothetical protein n=1 Tax=Cupriavidus necator TaxID=106590 RepID=UPI00339D57D0